MAKDALILLLKSTLEATHFGILVVDNNGHVLHCNQRFLQMWNISEDLATTRNERLMLAHALGQVVDPLVQMNLVETLYTNPVPMRDTVNLTDGRVFARTFVPLYSADTFIGFKWNFCDLTESTQDNDEFGAQLSERITSREREVLVLVGQGLTSKQIAAILKISPKTVANHRASILNKLDAVNFAELSHWITIANQYEATLMKEPKGLF